MKVVRSSEAVWKNVTDKGAYGSRRKELAGGNFACGLWELAPGKKSFPLHLHHVNQEGLFVISGRAQVRTPEGLTAIGPGDFVSFPPGGPAHQLINDGTEPLVYLGISSVHPADVVEFPDSDKVSAAVGRPPTGQRFIFRKGDQVDYYAGDKDAE